MNLMTILVIVLILVLVSVLPLWPHATAWGWAPSGVVGIIVLIIVVLLVTGRL